MLPQPPTSTLFPYTTLFRSGLDLPAVGGDREIRDGRILGLARPDRKGTRLNSSHLVTSYAVFCLKKKRRFLNAWEALKKVITRSKIRRVRRLPLTFSHLKLP